MKESRPYTATEVAIANPVIRVMSRLNTWAYRLTGGRVGGRRWQRTGDAAATEIHGGLNRSDLDAK